TVTSVPPDTNMAVGPNHIVQWVNGGFVIFNKQGAQVQAPIDDSTFWSALATCSQLGGFSHPIVQYYRAANPLLLTQVALPPSSPYPRPARDVLRRPHPPRPRRHIQHVGLRLRRRPQRLSQDRRLARRLLRHLEHVSERQ